MTTTPSGHGTKCHKILHGHYYRSCSPPAAEYALATVCQFDSLLSRAGLWYLGKGWIVRGTTTRRLYNWANGLFYRVYIQIHNIAQCHYFYTFFTWGCDLWLFMGCCKSLQRYLWSVVRKKTSKKGTCFSDPAYSTSLLSVLDLPLTVKQICASNAMCVVTKIAISERKAWIPLKSHICTANDCIVIGGKSHLSVTSEHPDKKGNFSTNNNAVVPIWIWLVNGIHAFLSSIAF